MAPAARAGTLRLRGEVNPRNTLLLFLFAALAGGALWWFELREGAASDDETTHVFAGVEAEQIDWIELAQADGASLRLEKRGDAWRITQPIDFAADRMAADGLASGLADLATDTVYDPAAEDPALHPEPPESYGLTREPRVRFSAAGKPHALRIGDPAPAGGDTYVAADGDARVFVVPSWQTSAFTKTLQELREARLLDFERDKLTRIALTWQGASAALEKKGDAWQITAPLADAADEVVVQALITDLQGLRVEGFLDAPPPDAELGLEKPSLRIELGLEGGASYALALGGPRENERVAARAGASGVVEVARSVVERLPKDVTALRDKTLASFVSSDAQRFTLSFTAPNGETLTVSGENGADGWKTQPPMEAGAASALVAEIASLAGSGIAAEELGPAELAAFGLAPPRARFEVRGGGEGDAAKLLADVRLGVLRKGSGLAAQRADRKPVYWIDESRAAALPQSAADFREKFAEKPKSPPASAPSAPAAAEPEAPAAHP
ncbi:MAG TPA: DUF4340 domain-containing protein [Myxococcota bacterium]|nr:DUF4340 domain-containing protein [Myxococcota bacterium]